MSRPEPDEVLDCVAELADSAGELHRSVSQLRELMSAATGGLPGRSREPVIPLEKRLAMTEQITQAVQTLTRNGNRFRRMEARALYAEGLTMAQLAAVFGVSRQRVSALLSAGRGDAAAAEGPAGTRRGDPRIAREGG